MGKPLINNDQFFRYKVLIVLIFVVQALTLGGLLGVAGVLGDILCQVSYFPLSEFRQQDGSDDYNDHVDRFVDYHVSDFSHFPAPSSNGCFCSLCDLRDEGAGVQSGKAVQ